MSSNKKQKIIKENIEDAFAKLQEMLDKCGCDCHYNNGRYHCWGPACCDEPYKKYNK